MNKDGWLALSGVLFWGGLTVVLLVILGACLIASCAAQL